MYILQQQISNFDVRRLQLKAGQMNHTLKWMNILKVLASIPKTNTYTVFPQIVSAETILFWKLLSGKYSREETIVWEECIPGRKLYEFDLDSIKT